MSKLTDLLKETNAEIKNAEQTVNETSVKVLSAHVQKKVNSFISESEKKVKEAGDMDIDLDDDSDVDDSDLDNDFDVEDGETEVADDDFEDMGDEEDMDDETDFDLEEPDGEEDGEEFDFDELDDTIDSDADDEGAELDLSNDENLSKDELTAKIEEFLNSTEEGGEVKLTIKKEPRYRITPDGAAEGDSGMDDLTECEDESLKEGKHMFSKARVKGMPTAKKKFPKHNSPAASTTQKNRNKGSKMKAMHEGLKKLNSQTQKLMQENANLKNQLSKAAKSLKESKETISVMGAQFSRLGYMSRFLAENKSLTQSQKERVVEAFDRANTKEDTARLFKMLTETTRKKKTTKLPSKEQIVAENSKDNKKNQAQNQAPKTKEEPKVVVS